jgi:hypothetical protein
MKRKKNGFRLSAHPALLMAAILAAALLLPALALTAEGDTKEFRYYSLDFKGDRRARVITDVNGDGLLDLVMVYATAAQRDSYFLRVCPQEREAGFSGNCAELTLPKGARAFDVGEVDGQAGAELVVLTDVSIEMASFASGRFGPLQRLSSDQSILAGTADGEPRLLRFLWDVNGDQKKELVLPTMQGPALYKHEGGLALLQQINSPAHVTYRVGSLGDISRTDDLNQFLRYQRYVKRTSATYTAPDVFITDFDGDKKVDVVTLIDNTLRVFPQGPDGRFADSPAVTFKRSILPPEEKGLGFAGEAMTFSDLNADGIADIIMMKWGASQERTKMDRYIYYGQSGLRYPEEPDQIIGSENAAVDFGIYDINNDGKKDLVIPFFHFAPAQAFKVITENAIKIQFWIFLMKENGQYSQDPGKRYAKVDTRVPITYKIDILGMLFDLRTLIEGKFFPLIAFGHDLNGDGYLDLVADTGNDKLEITYGNAEAKFKSIPDLTIDFESALDYDLLDVNADGKCDIITYYESKERTSKKRELAQKARQAGASDTITLEEGALRTAEGTRVKALISK